MDLEKIKAIIGDNTLSYAKISSFDVANIMEHVNVKLYMDDATLDYYYGININDLVSSDIVENDIENLKKQGWSFSDDNTKLIIYLTNSN